MPNYGVGYFLDVVQIVVEVLRKYSNLIVKGYLTMIVLGIYRRGSLEILKGKVLVRLDLLMVLTEVRVFLVMMILLYQKKYLLAHLLCSVHPVYMSVLSNMVVFLWRLGD